MSFTQPILRDGDFAEVCGNVWGAERAADVLADFAQALMQRFPGEEQLQLGRFGPDAQPQSSIMPQLLRQFLCMDLDETAPLISEHYALLTGRYQCKIYVLDEIPFYRADLGEFRDSVGDIFPYEVDNVPTVRIFPRDSSKTFFAHTDDTEELCVFLEAQAARLGLVFNGNPGDSFFELKLDRRRFVPLRRTLRIPYNSVTGEEDASDISDEELDALLDP